MITQKGTGNKSDLFLDWIDDGQIFPECSTVDLSSIVETTCERKLIDENVFLNFDFEFRVIFLIIDLENFKFLIKATSE